MQRRFPPLAEPYAAALREAVDFLFARFEPVGIVATGTIVRGNPAPSSDLDLFVVHRQPWRQRLQKFFKGVPAEIFVNPPERVERYFEEERRGGRPITAHMLATGFAIYDPEGVVERIRVRATEALASGPEVTDAGLLQRRYFVATMLEDAVDIADVDPDRCAGLLTQAVEEAVRYRFWVAHQWQPRHKELLTALDALDAEQAEWARAFYRTADSPERIRLATVIVERSIGATGFFEWESEVSV